MSDINKLVAISGLCLALCACSSPTMPDGAGRTQDTPGPSPIKTCCINPDRERLSEAGVIPATRNVYFDYDAYTVSESDRAILVAHSKYLIAHPQQHVVLQGNTDRRGGREYNLALGQKRSEAVRTLLHLLGVSDNQMEAISYGAERPRQEGDDEAAYAQNRRVDLVY